MKIRLWLLIGIYISLIGILGSLLISHHSRPKLDCTKAMASWNYYEGQAAIEAFKGRDMNSQILKGDYERLVMGDQKACFPTQLVEYIKNNP